ncbi:type VI secretion system baseplate subunit TssF, partial [Candidatus Poribacteria bacterium]
MRDSSGPRKKRKTTIEYYDEEQRYLDEAGREFAQAYPGRARFLNIGQRDDRDPYIERLFEGFAFLTGRVRQKLDDELPELTQSLLGLLWPHLLRPIPSISVLEFQPSLGRFQEPHIVERGTEVASQPVRRRYSCRFQTCYDVHVRPIALTEVALEDNFVMRFQFRIDEGIDLSKLFSMEGGDNYQNQCRKSIRLFIHDVDQRTAATFHLYLTRYVQKVAIQTTPDGPGAIIDGQAGVQLAGFAPEEGLLPYKAQSFVGYRLLQEYFAYSRKFSFFDLFGFERLRSSEEVGNLEVRVFFDRPFPMDIRFARENFRLNCTPIVNLSRTQAQPRPVSHESTEYRISPPDGYEVYSVDAVEGVVPSTMQRRPYVPFYSFRHDLVGDGVEQPDRYYNTITRMATRRNEEGQPENYQNTYLSIVNPDVEVGELNEETLSLQITCTNGTLARELKEGDIRNRVSDSNVPEFVQFRNITQPTPILYPPHEAGLEWRFISHLALNYLSLSDAETMKGILELYDWTTERSARDTNRLRISSIRNVRVTPQDI